ncbi:30744_t:CDS:1, partial [Gigaspora margarita]
MELYVEVGENKSIVQAKNADQAVRFLEDWLIGKGGKRHVNKIIQREIDALVQ